MTALYTGQIKFLGARLLHGTDVRWPGAFARDKIQELKNERGLFAVIIKTDEAVEDGEQWLALYGACGFNKIEMFDSFYFDPKLYSFDQFLSCGITYSSRTIQDISSKVSGHYASRCRSFAYAINSLYTNFTHASAARKMLDVALSKLFHMHCLDKLVKFNHITPIVNQVQMSEREINRHREWREL